MAPGGDAAHLSGLPLADGDEPVARARRFAPPPGSSPQGALDMISRRRCCASVRATGSSPSASGSPDRCAASPPGRTPQAALDMAPGGDAAHLSGLPLADGDGPVARARRFAPLPGKARRGLFAQQPLQARLTPAIDPFAKNKQAQPFNRQQRSPDDRHPCGPVALCAAQPVQQRQQNANDDGHRQ